MMKKMLLMLGVCLLCTGCGKMQEGCEYNENYYEEGEEVMYELTAEQEELLCAISVKAERVKEGDLYGWQVEVLKQYDFAMDYLREKYPSYSFKIVGCAPKNVVNSYTTFDFVEVNNEEQYYALYLDVLEGEEPVYVAEDNFYGDIKEEELAEQLFTLLKAEFPNCLRVSTNVTTVEGREFDEKLDVSKVVSGEIKMQQDTTIYISENASNEETYAQKVQEINAFLTGKGITGSFDVVILDAGDEETELYSEIFIVSA